MINESEAEHREVVAKLGKLGEYVEKLDYKDVEMESLCRERFSIIADIMNVYDYADVLQSVSSVTINTYPISMGFLFTCTCLFTRMRLKKNVEFLRRFYNRRIYSYR